MYQLAPIPTGFKWEGAAPFFEWLTPLQLFQYQSRFCNQEPLAIQWTSYLHIFIFLQTVFSTTGCQFTFCPLFNLTLFSLIRGYINLVLFISNSPVLELPLIIALNTSRPTVYHAATAIYQLRMVVHGDLPAHLFWCWSQQLIRHHKQNQSMF